MVACLQRRIDKSYKTGEFNEETVFGTGRTCMQYLFPSALTAVEISLLTEDAQLSLFQRSFGNTKGCVLMCAALGELGESSSGSATRLSTSAGFMMHLYSLLPLSEVC